MAASDAMSDAGGDGSSGSGGDIGGDGGTSAGVVPDVQVVGEVVAVDRDAELGSGAWSPLKRELNNEKNNEKIY